MEEKLARVRKLILTILEEKFAEDSGMFEKPGALEILNELL